MYFIIQLLSFVLPSGITTSDEAVPHDLSVAANLKYGIENYSSSFIQRWKEVRESISSWSQFIMVT